MFVMGTVSVKPNSRPCHTALRGLFLYNHVGTTRRQSRVATSPSQFSSLGLLHTHPPRPPKRSRRRSRRGLGRRPAGRPSVVNSLDWDSVGSVYRTRTRISCYSRRDRESELHGNRERGWQCKIGCIVVTHRKVFVLFVCANERSLSSDIRVHLHPCLAPRDPHRKLGLEDMEVHNLHRQ